MKKVIAILVAVMGFSTVVSAAGVRNVCDKQVRGYMASQVGAEITNIDWFYGDSDRHDHRSRAWVRADNCSGHYVFEMNSDRMNCRIIHYGHIPNYIRNVWTTGDCQL